MEFKDYYQILGVEPGAGDSEIKTAYRRLARKYHPDVSKEAGAEDKFKAVNEAYEALRDPQKRAAYDQLRARGYRPGDDVQPPPGRFPCANIAALRLGNARLAPPLNRGKRSRRSDCLPGARPGRSLFFRLLPLGIVPRLCGRSLWFDRSAPRTRR